MALFHQKIELHTDLSAEETAEVMRSELNSPLSGFHGKEKNEEFVVDYQSRGLNAFRPEITLTVLPEEQGASLMVHMGLPMAMTGFMLLWTLIPVLYAVFGRNGLALLLLPVFWVIAVVGFRMGVKPAKEALMALLGAVEVMD